ncbi:MAG: thiamine biosynthesis protein [Desulfofustis sp.]|nr:thiamine biosynthesis protein [Desulfofustis sp.]NNK14670.1 thiamine biosynthesis protein [Desulfofustis sp.]
MSRVRAISLFSGGLDSICATRVVMAQGVEVLAIKFVSPFFGYDILRDPDGYRSKIKQKYGIEVSVYDISEEYLQMLRSPSHGFGKYFNPCVDCKIFMLERAKTMLDEFGASFLITGEVLGQRPMSQRRDTLNVIERDSATRSLLLRPLSAKLMNPTEAELNGWVDREKLLDFSGRGRSRQIALAKSFGITDFPAPAGGCILADPILSTRIARVYNNDFVVTQQNMNVADILLMLIGRQFLLPNRGWLVLGREEKENDRLEELQEPGDIKLFIEERPGPVALLRRAAELYDNADARGRDLEAAAGLVARYAKKKDGRPTGGNVIIIDDAAHSESFYEPLMDGTFRDWII